MKRLLSAAAVLLLCGHLAFGQCSRTSTTALCPTEDFTPPSASGSKATDPSFTGGTEILRLTDSTLCSGQPGISPYAYWSAFNYNETKVLALCGTVLHTWDFDRVNFTISNHQAETSNTVDVGNGYYWDDADPNLIWGVPSLSPFVRTYDVATNTVTNIVNLTSVITAHFGSAGTGGSGTPNVWYVTQPSMSADRSRIALNVRKWNVDADTYSYDGFLVYDLVASSTVIIKTNAENDGRNVNEVHLSEDGLWANVDVDAPAQGQMLWHLTDNTFEYHPLGDPVNFPGEEGAAHNVSASNYGVGYTAGDTYAAVRWNFTTDGLWPITILHNFGYGAGGSNLGVMHVSASGLNDDWALMSLGNRQDRVVSTGYNSSATSIVITGTTSLAGGFGWFTPYYVQWWDSTTYGENPGADPNMEIVTVTAKNDGTSTLTVTRGTQGTTAAAHNTVGKTYKMSPISAMGGELVLISTVTPGTVHRIINSRTEYSDYQYSPFANLSPSGEFVMWQTTLANSATGGPGSTGRTDAFVAKIASSPAAYSLTTIPGRKLSGGAKANGGVKLY